VLGRKASGERKDDDYDAVYAELFMPAMRLAFRILGDRHAAEDVAAEALARAYASWPKVRDLEYRDAWVLRVATNLAIDVTRRKTPEIAVRSGADFEDVAAARVALSAALRALPPRQRHTISLYYLGDLSDAEVGAALGIAASSVRTHLQRGLSALRQQLGPNITEVTDGLP
jgi:RNA polymerase sigma-70 factor (ECF subfamily)